MNGDDIVLVRFHRPVLVALTRWASGYLGKCQHADRRQMTRVGESRSRCVECLVREHPEGLQPGSVCDSCGAAVPAGDVDHVFFPDLALTAGIAVAVTVCRRCGGAATGTADTSPHHEDRDGRGLDDHEGVLPMSISTEQVCPSCQGAFASYTATGAREGDQLPLLHRECRRGLMAAMSGFSRRHPEEPREVRLAVVRAVARLALGGSR